MVFDARAIFVEEQLWYYLTHSWEDKGVHAYPKGICEIMKMIAWLEFELAYYDIAVQHISHYTSRNSPTNGICNKSPNPG